LHFVLDSNEYIFAFGLSRQEDCELLIEQIIKSRPLHPISICRTIIEEVRANLTQKDFQKFVKLINIFAVIDEDFLIPFELGVKYELRGLKEADALIAAYTEWVGADALITENRHFLSRNSNLPFKILNADDCLKFITASLQ